MVAAQTGDPLEAAAGADALYTCVSAWATRTRRPRAAQGPFQLNEELMAAASERAIALHCLPAPRRGDHGGRALRRALGRLGSGREPAPRPEGAARAPARLIGGARVPAVHSCVAAPSSSGQDADFHSGNGSSILPGAIGGRFDAPRPQRLNATRNRHRPRHPADLRADVRARLHRRRRDRRKATRRARQAAGLGLRDGLRGADRRDRRRAHRLPHPELVGGLGRRARNIFSGSGSSGSAALSAARPPSASGPVGVGCSTGVSPTSPRPASRPVTRSGASVASSRVTATTGSLGRAVGNGIPGRDRADDRGGAPDAGLRDDHHGHRRLGPVEARNRFHPGMLFALYLVLAVPSGS